VFLSLFGSFSQLAHAPSVVALQDPPVYRGKLPSFQFYSSFSPPGTGNKKPALLFMFLVPFCSLLLYFCGSLTGVTSGLLTISPLMVSSTPL